MTSQQRRTPLRGRDGGAATLEYSALIAGVAAMLVLVVVALTGNAPVLASQFTRAVCMVFSTGSGSCAPLRSSAAEHRPTDPCIVASNGHSNQVTLSFVVTGSKGEKWQVDQLSDGRYRVTRGTSEGVGWEPGVGFNATVTVDDNSFGAQAEAGVDLEATFGTGEVYYVQNQDELKALFGRHIRDTTEDTVLGDSGPLRWLWDAGNDVVGTDNHLPPSSEVYYEGGFTASAEAGATSWTASANGQVGVQAVLGYRTGHDGSTTEYFKASVSGGAEGSLVGPVLKAKAEGNVDAVLEIERDPSGNITAIRVRSVVAGTADAAVDTRAGDPDAGSYTETVVELPTHNPADQQVAQDFLSSMGMYSVPGFTTPPLHAPGLSSASAALAFAQAASARGHMTQQSYDYSTTGHGAQVSGKPIVGDFGLEGEYTGNSRNVTAGSYFDGVRWVPWPGCGGS